jgi:hypothetical protein
MRKKTRKQHNDIKRDQRPADQSALEDSDLEDSDVEDSDVEVSEPEDDFLDGDFTDNDWLTEWRLTSGNTHHLQTRRAIERIQEELAMRKAFDDYSFD